MEFVGSLPQPTQVRYRLLTAARQGTGVQSARAQDELRGGGVLLSLARHGNGDQPGKMPAEPLGKLGGVPLGRRDVVQDGRDVVQERAAVEGLPAPDSLQQVV